MIVFIAVMGGNVPSAQSAWTPAVLAAVIAGGVAIISWVLNSIVAAVREDRGRRREQFSRAFAATVAYAEFPYVVRRRDPTNPGAERIRISEALRGIQQDIAYHEAWLVSESPKVGRAYEQLVVATRRVAGQAIHDAWLESGAAGDDEMNMPDLGLGELKGPRNEFLEEVRRNLRPVRSRRLKS